MSAIREAEASCRLDTETRVVEPPRERGILFSAPMVRAIVDGRKTQTRRLMKPQPVWSPEWGSALGKSGAWIYGNEKDTGDQWWVTFDEDHQRRACTEEAYGWGARAGCPYGLPGHRLWVRETWGLASYTDPTHWRRGSLSDTSVEDLRDAWQVEYRADWGSSQENCCWRSSLYMPRWASRITLEVTEVRAERLQSISEEDAKAEGVRYCEVCDDTGLVRIVHDPEWCPDCGGSAQGRTRDEFSVLWDAINRGRADWASNPFVWAITFRVVP